MKTIGGVFGRPLFSALYEHALKVQDSLALLRPLMVDFVEGRHEQVQRGAAEIHQKENEADAIKSETRRSLSRSIFNAVERSEVLILLKAQDDVIDNCWGVAKLLEIRRTAVCPEIAHELLQLTQSVALTVESLVEVEYKLAQLEGTSYPRSEMDRLTATIEHIHLQEHESDTLEHSALKAVFRNESRLDPVSCVFLMSIARGLGAIAGSVQNTAESLERIGLR